MHPHLKSLLVKAGCEPTASDDDAQKFYDGMAADKKGEIDAKLAKLMAGEDEDDDEPTGALSTPPLPGTEVAVPAVLSAKQLTEIASNAIKAALAANAGANPAGRVGTTNGGNVASDGDTILALEGKRVTQITQLGAMLKVSDEVVKRCIGANMKVEDARVDMLKEVHATAKPLNSVKVGDDKAIASLQASISQGILLHAGWDRKSLEKHGEKVHERAPEMAALGFKRMFLRYLAQLGFQEAYEFSDTKLAECLGPRGMRKHLGSRVAMLAESTSDFANITIDAQNKSLRFFYLDAKRTWPIWCEKKFAPDFKNVNRVVLSEAPSMQKRNEGGEVKYVQLQDSKELYQLAEYVEGIRITRRALINDSMDAFASIPRLHANAAARLEDDLAYAVLTLNAAMADGGALFNATAFALTGTPPVPDGGHQNYSPSDAAPSVSTLQKGSTAIKKQKGLANASRLELEPKFLLVPTSIEEQTKEFIGSGKLIASQSSSGSAPLTVGDSNPFFNRYQVVGSTRLDDVSTTAWFLLVDFRDGQINTFEICFLQDEPEPVIRQETDFDTEDVKYLCRHSAVAACIDWRGAYKSNGA